MKYQFNTNDVLVMGTNLLRALEIDGATLYRRQIVVRQSDFHSETGLVRSPTICGFCGNENLRDPGTNGFAFKVSAVSGDLLELNVGCSSTCNGLPLITNADKLAAISDEDFYKYSQNERDKLVPKFATGSYLKLTNLK
jgi:hypothetical protein